MRLLYKDEAVRHLKKINPSDLKKVFRKIQRLKTDPLLGKPLHGEYEGQYTLRAWPLRIIYTYERKTKTVEIITIDYRGSVYGK